ncbi:methionyl-tRNA formyltransferase [Propionicimonas paludicola]|uniref:Methionyl-tRNA formyltransferase n=1 Tax=Propionicimonas paludicola TaxID=185243 RepID=A0A2A9CQT7_9ACTN|nr:methionyl-tRNA formyltransferase [Propionicimonas paludicola]PFG16708.1 methionyl-tRNA formyltransferase [Propionicimonas paludicola]
MRLVFAGTPQLAADTLQVLLDSGRHQVVAVLTRPDAAKGRSARLLPSPVAELAEQRGIEVLKPARPSEPWLAQRLAELNIDCVPVVAYGGLIPSSLLEAIPQGWMNLHFSLLPRWRGAAPVQRAILAGDQVSGVTIFDIVAELDAGPVLATAPYEFGPDETAGEALAGLTTLGAGLLLETLDRLEAGSAVAEAQPSDGVTLAPKLTPAEARLDWTAPAEALARVIRANNPSPIAWTTLNGERFRVLRARPVEGAAEPGVVEATKNSVLVGTGAGLLELVEVQPAGKRVLAAADWARGLRQASRFE